MKKYLITTIAISILFISTLSYAKTPMYSTEVDQGLSRMFNKSGLVDGIYWSGGQITRFSDIGAGNVSYPINLAGGTETTGILPQTQGGWGTDTTGTIGVVAGRIGIGTTTPSTALHIIGTVTATGATVAGVTAPYISQTSGTGTGITLAGNTNFPSGIWNSSGNVGIGITTPGAILNADGGSVQSDQFIRIGAKDTYDTGLQFTSNDGSSWITKNAIINESQSTWFRSNMHFVLNDAASSANYTLADAKMTLTYGGSVGIGETAPGSKLSVSGGGSFGTSYDTTAAPANGLIVEGKIGIGTTTPTTTLQVIGTVTATGFSGNGAGLTNLVKQISGTSTGMTADNIAIVGTNSTATFKDVTITGTLESGSQWSTAGSWTSTVGVGQSARIVSLGNSTNSISLECDGTTTTKGSGTAEFISDGGNTLGTSTFSSRFNKNKYYATSVGSTTVSGTTTETILASILIPAGFMSSTGSFEIYSLWDCTNGGSSTAKTLRMRYGTESAITAGLMAVSSFAAANRSLAFYNVFGNDGTATAQVAFWSFAFNVTTAGLPSTAYNTQTQDTYILLTGSMGTTSDNLSLRYKVKYYE